MADIEDGIELMPDYGHILVTIRPDLEMRLNRKARMYKRLDPVNDGEVARKLKAEVVELLLKVFYVRGIGVSGGIDETFASIMSDSLDKYDPSIGIPYSGFVRFLHDRRKRNPLTKEDQFNYDMLVRYGSDFEAGDREELDGLSSKRPHPEEWGLGDAASGDASAAEDMSEVGVAQAEDAAMEAVFLNMLTLVVAFLEHAEDKRDFTPRKKLYTRMFFTESVTRLVKSRTMFEECRPFQKHERDTFSTMELPFQDMYMAGLCRTICDIWQTALKDGFGSISAGAATWKLPADTFRDYVFAIEGEMISRPVVSEQRNNYKKLQSQLMCRAS